MSYKVLSLKLRPQKFDDVIGQLHVTKTLQNAINLDRVAHSYIFSGPRGVGKTTTARILSKALNCEKMEHNNPCSTCNNCIEITQGSNLDVQELDGASNRGIDEIRNLREAVKYPPNSGKFRIYIIDEVHMLTREAFNALLKTLEEPPSHVIFIMATTDAHKIPITILSRAQKFDFKSIRVNDITKYLEKIVENENITYDLKSLDLIAHKASGSLRDSLSLLDQVIAYTNDKLNVEAVSEVLGIIKEDIFLNIIQNIEKNDIKSIVININKIIISGYSIPDFIIGFNEFIRNCMLVKSDINKNLLSQESINWLKTCRFSITDFLRILDVSLKFELNLKFVQYPNILIETHFIKLTKIFSNVDKKEILNVNSNNNSIKLDITEKKIIKDKNLISKDQNIIDESEKENNTNNIEVQTNDVFEITLEKIKNLWNVIIDKLEKENSKIAHFLEEVELINFKNQELTINLNNGSSFHIKTLERDDGIIQLILEDVLKQKVKLKYQISNNSDKEEENKNSKDSDHPLLIKALETFEGEIIR